MAIAQGSISVAEIGSFFVGGRMIRLAGLPKRERVSTSGGAIHAIDPNVELMAGQLYVQYVRLTEPHAAPLLLWHGGDVLSSHRLRHLRFRRGRAGPRLLGALSAGL